MGVGETNDITTEQTVAGCWNVPQVAGTTARVDTHNLPTVPKLAALIYSHIDRSVLT